MCVTARLVSLPVKVPSVHASSAHLVPLPPVQVSSAHLVPLPPVQVSSARLVPLPPVQVSSAHLVPLPPVQVSSAHLVPLPPVQVSSSIYSRSAVDFINIGVWSSFFDHSSSARARHPRCLCLQTCAFVCTSIAAQARVPCLHLLHYIIRCYTILCGTRTRTRTRTRGKMRRAVSKWQLLLYIDNLCNLANRRAHGTKHAPYSTVGSC